MALFDFLGRAASDAFSKGIAAFDDRDFALAADCFADCLQNESDGRKRRLARFYYSESLSELCREALRSEDWDQTARSFVKAVEKQPKYPDLRLVLAISLAKTGDLNRAFEQAEIAHRLDPHYAKAVLALGWILLQQGDYSAGMERVNGAFGMDDTLLGPESTETCAAADAGDWSDAIKLIEKILIESEAPNLLAIQAANRLFMLGDYAAASFEFERALVSTPGYADLWCRLGECRLALGKPAEAIEALVCALSINFKYADAHYQLARGLLELGRQQEAVATLQQLVAMQPDYPGAKELLLRTSS